MTSPATVPIEGATRMQITSPIHHLCPFVNEVDNGTATIGWDGDGRTFELHSLRAYLNEFAPREMSHEDLTNEIQSELSAHPGITNITVTTSWETAGMEVRCSTSPILAPQP